MSEFDPNFSKQVERLYQLKLYGRWLMVLCCWISLGSIGIWGLRREITLWLEYFTWSALRYALMFNPIPGLCLIVCIAVTCSVLVWQSRNILQGLPSREKYRLEQEVKKIIASGSRHPLWKWIVDR